MSATTINTGTAVYWSLPEQSAISQDDLERKLQVMGLQKYTPSRQTHAGALKIAASKVYRGHMVRSLAQHRGYAVVEEGKGFTANNYDNVDSIILDGSSFTTSGVKQPELAFEYHAALSSVVPENVRRELAKAMANMGGHQIFDSKWTWVPRWSLERIAELEEAFMGVGRAYKMTTGNDPATVEMILESIEGDIQAQIKLAQGELEKGESGVKAIQNRRSNFQAALEHVQQVEQMLGARIPTLQESIVQMETTLATVELMKSAVTP